MQKKRKILIIHRASRFPIRKSAWDHLYCFKRYSNYLVYYFNIFFDLHRWWLKKINYDVVIFDHSVTSFWDESKFLRHLDFLKSLDFSKSLRAAFFQDEFFHSKVRCRFINELHIRHVFSVAPESEWKKIYPDVDQDTVKFHKVLTGYIDDRVVNACSQLEKKIKKTIDIGYRTVWNNAYRLGRHGLIKSQIADIFCQKTSRYNLFIDISTNPKDHLTGMNWFKFLIRCKYTLGVLSGASLLDIDGSINKKIEKYVTVHPKASFEEVEKECFPGMDGNLSLFGVSPRHFEACITRTCQVLIEGDYDGILKPGVHYIELKSDYSNIDEIMKIIKQDELRGAIVKNAYRDIVESGKYFYRNYVDFVFHELMKNKESLSKHSFWDKPIYGLAVFLDKLNWAICFIISHFIRPVYHLFKM